MTLKQSRDLELSIWGTLENTDKYYNMILDWNYRPYRTTIKSYENQIAIKDGEIKELKAKMQAGLFDDPSVSEYEEKKIMDKISDLKEKIKDEEEKISVKKRDRAPLYASVGIQKIEYKDNETKIKLWIDQDTAIAISQIVKDLGNCLVWLIAPSDADTFTFERN
jgi:small nuclear ribonucleoprotein (snRNP)-like protein